MGTAAIIAGNLLASKGAKEQAEAQVEAAEIQAAQAEKARQDALAQQAIENARAEALLEPSIQAQQTQLALLGQGGPQAAQQAADKLMNSPLVAAINQQNQQNVAAQAAASGMSGGNLLAALQDANTATIMQAGFGGLGQVAGQQQGAALGFAGLGMNALGMANQQTNLVGQFQGQAAAAQGTANALPWLTGANVVNQLNEQAMQAAGMISGGGFGGASSGGAGFGGGMPAGGGAAPIF